MFLRFILSMLQRLTLLGGRNGTWPVK